MKLNNMLYGMFIAVILAVGVIHQQPSQAAALTDTYENSIIDWLMRGQSLTPPATGYIALFTVAPTDSTSGTEVSGGSYARVAVTASLSNWAGTQSAGSTTASSGTGGTTSNNAVITFPTATADWGTVVGFAYMSASSGGTMLFYAPLAASRSITNGSTASFAAGTLTFTIDN